VWPQIILIPQYINQVHKVDVPNSTTGLNQTPTFEWYEGRYGSKSIYHEVVCLKETGLHAQNMILIILNSILKIMRGDLYDHLTSTNHYQFALITNKMFICNKLWKLWGKWLRPRCEHANPTDILGQVDFDKNKWPFTHLPYTLPTPAGAGH
jgi:hypothetical protein